MGGKGC